MTNPNDALGTNGAYGGRTSVDALNDVLSTYKSRGVLSGFLCEAKSGMTVTVGGTANIRDVAIAEDAVGNKTTINNISGTTVDVTVDTASTTSDRIDAIVAYVNNPATVGTTTLDNPEAVGIISVNGTSVEPTEAAIRSAITADGGTGTTAYYVVLAIISVPMNTTTITNTLITQGEGVELTDNAMITSQNIDSTTLNRINRVVYDNTLTSTVSSGFTVSGLDLEGDGGVYDFVLTTTGTSGDYDMKFNGNTGIYRQMISVNIQTSFSADADTVSSDPKYRGSQNRGAFYGFGAYGDTMITATICRINGHIHMQWQTSMVMNGNQKIFSGTIVTDSTISNLTSLYFSKAVSAGTRILITKRAY